MISFAKIFKPFYKELHVLSDLKVLLIFGSTDS